MLSCLTRHVLCYETCLIDRQVRRKGAIDARVPMAYKELKRNGRLPIRGMILVEDSVHVSRAPERKQGGEEGHHSGHARKGLHERGL